MSTKRDFSGKVVLITGSSDGIGAVNATEFSRAGANVVVTGRNAEKVATVGKECLKVSPKALKALEVLADVSEEMDCKRLIDSTIKEFGKLDILVNNAGFGAISSITDSNILEKYQRVMDTNLRSVVYLTHLSVEHLEKTKGNIINISSVCGLKPFLHAALYCMSKSALDMLTKCLALELAPKEIRSGYYQNKLPQRTNFLSKTNRLSVLGLDQGQIEARWQKATERYPLGRVGESIDISNAIMFLASDESSFITGINIVSDGGSLNSSSYSSSLSENYN